MSDTQAISKVLKTVPLFQRRDSESLDRMARVCRMKELSAGELVFAERDYSGEIFILVSGQVRLTCDTGGGPEVVVGYAESGDLVGEMGIIDPAPRSASARSVGKSTLLVLPGGDFMALVAEEQSVAVDLLQALRRSLTYRIRVLNERTEALFLLDQLTETDAVEAVSIKDRLRAIWTAMRSGA
jgi:CRP/FNR family cyclic AMP-dependent transcriptional regulator